MKKGWKYVTLDKVCKVQNGFAFDSKLFGSIGVPLIRIRDIKRGYSETYTTETAESMFFVENGDILIGMDGDFNIGEWRGGHALLNQRVCKLIPSQNLQSRFAMYFLPKALNEINSKTAFSTVKHLSSKQVNKIEVPLLSFSEQQSIVAHLDASFAEIDALKAKAAEEVANAKAMFDAALREEMTPIEGWEEKTLKDLSLIAGNYGLSVPSCKYNGIRYLRITDITEWGELNNDFVSADIESTDNQIELQEGDILFARTGATVGKTLVYRESMGQCVFAGYLIRYRVDHNVVLPRYMFYETHSPWYFEWVKKNQQAAAQPNISAKLYNTYLVKFPGIDMQQRIVTKLDTLRSHLTEFEQKYNLIAANCDALKQAILRETFE